MNVLCFVSIVLMVCWNLHISVEIYTFNVNVVLMVCRNLHIPGVEIYTFNVNVVLMVCWNVHIPGVEIYTLSVNVVLMVCWNLHIPGVEIYTFSVNVVLMVCWNLHIPRVEIYTFSVHGLLKCMHTKWQELKSTCCMHGYLGEFGVHLNITCWMSLYNCNKPFGDWGLEILPVPGTEHFLGTFFNFFY